MAASSESLLGRIAQNLGFLRTEQIRECLQLQFETGLPLGRLLIEKGYLTSAQLEKALEVQRRNLAENDPDAHLRKKAAYFGRLAVREGYITEDHLRDCLEERQRPGETRTLGEILVARGYLTARQVRQILSQQVRKTMACPFCRLTFTVLTLTGGNEVRCPRCEGPLAEAVGDSTDAQIATGTFVVAELHDVPPREAPIVQTTCIVCDHPFQGSADDTGRLTCPQCRSSFLPR